MTIDTALNQLYPVNQIGSDGFNWWIGQIEEMSRDDPKGSGRCKVRIVGLHPQSCAIVANEDLPWAQIMMPVTNPHIPGACVSVSDQLYQGVWVVGFFLDNEKQQPMIMGSIGLVANSTETEIPAADLSKECRSFTTFMDDNKVAADQGSENTAARDQQDVGTVSNGKTIKGSPIIASKDTNLQVAHKGENTDLNPGRKVCVMKADKCGKETDLKGTFTNLIGEMLHEVQRNDGKLGNYLVSPLSGQLYDMMDIGRDYVDVSVQIIRTFVANVKGFVIAKIKEGIQALTTALLRPTKDGNALTPLTNFFNEHLEKVGCSMADLGDRIAKWLEDVIFGYLFNLYKSTACQIDKFVSGLLNEIESLMSDLLNNLLGPLQAVLGAIASPLNMIGDAINHVLSLLGISCTGPKKGCSKKTKVCSDNKTEERKSFLDDLLSDLENWPTGQDWNQYTCDDAYEGTKLEKTEVSFVGGKQITTEEQRYIYYSITPSANVKEGEEVKLTIERTGMTDVASSVRYNCIEGSATSDIDYENTSGVVGFAPGESSHDISIRTYADSEVDGYEDFFVKIVKETPVEDGSDYRSKFKSNISRIVIKESGVTVDPDTDLTGEGVDSSVTTSNPEFPSFNITNVDDIDTEVDIPDGETVPESSEPTYEVIADKTSVKEGEFITYTIKTKNVDFGTKLSYKLFGTNITPSDIVGNNLSGTIVIEDFEEYNAKIVIGIKEDLSNEGDEVLVFSIPGTAAQASVLILSDTSELSFEDRNRIDDQSTDETPVRGNTIPTVNTIITGPGGEIVSVPVDNTGDPYDEPPHVFITGQGYGATGRALLDSNGYVTEIRVVDPGVGYKLNTPDVAKKECIIDSFTMISPGREFKSTPKVWINGDDSIAEALINTKGQVISVRIKNREMTFDSYPEVIINGGGGYGAKFVPSFACLDPDVRVKIGSAKVGTGSYIDCP